MASKVTFAINEYSLPLPQMIITYNIINAINLLKQPTYTLENKFQNFKCIFLPIILIDHHTNLMIVAQIIATQFHLFSGNIFVLMYCSKLLIFTFHC